MFVNADDASLINEAASGATVPQIPSVPPGVSLTFGGPDPYLYLSAVQGSPGQTVTETLYLDVTDPNGIELTALDEAIGFDAEELQVSDVRSALGLAGIGSYATASTVDNGSGVLLVGQPFMGSGLPPVVPYGTDIPVLQFDVTLNADASAGSVTGLTMLQDGTINGQTKYTAISDNEGALTWTPGMAPSNRGNAAIDGSVTVVPASASVVPEVVAPATSRPAVEQPKVVEPVRRVTPVSQTLPTTTVTIIGLVVPVGNNEGSTLAAEVVASNASPLLASPGAPVQPETGFVTIMVTVAPTISARVHPDHQWGCQHHKGCGSGCFAESRRSRDEQDDVPRVDEPIEWQDAYQRVGRNVPSDGYIAECAAGKQLQPGVDQRGCNGGIGRYLGHGVLPG